MDNISLHAVVTALLLSNTRLQVGVVAADGIHAIDENSLPKAGCLATEIIKQSWGMSDDAAD